MKTICCRRLSRGAALAIALAAVALVMTPGVWAEEAKGAEIGKAAPGFTLPDVSGAQHSLKDYAGKVVVLEWFNDGCPFVRKHYDSKNMQSMQKKYADKGVVWLTICSSAPGKQGYYEAPKMKEVIEGHGATPTAMLLDPAGDVGRLYGARTTPHMYVIDKGGALVYNGAIDSIRSTDKADIEKATNYVAEALDAVLAGQKVETPVTTPYGCSVKY